MRVRRAGPFAIAVLGFASRAVAQPAPAAEPVPAAQPVLAPAAPAPPPPAVPPAQPALAPRGAPEPVRVTYDAPPSCPSEDVFLALVRARVGTGWEAPPGALARTLTVRVLSNEASSVARIEYTDDAGNPVSRTVGANTCGEVVSGIALVTALAIESRLGPPPPASEPPPPPVAPRVTPPARPPPAEPTPNRQTQIPHVDLGAGALALSGVGPSFAVGAHGFVGLGWEHGPDFRVGFGAPQTPWENAPNTNSQSQFTLYAVRVSGCPFAFESEPVRALPCVGLETGVHHAESLGSPVEQVPRSYDTGSASPPFVAPFLSLRGEASLGAAFVELEAEARFPLGNRKFQYTEPPTSVYAVPAVAFGALLAVGVRL